MNKGKFIRMMGLLLVSAMLLTWQQRASERSHLASLSDHHLKDMGLSRAEAQHEVQKPFWLA